MSLTILWAATRKSQHGTEVEVIMMEVWIWTFVTLTPSHARGMSGPNSHDLPHKQ